MAEVKKSPEFDKHLGKVANNEILRKLEEAKYLMKRDRIKGDQISKRLFPREYIQRYRINNLWRYSISSHRLIYTIVTEHYEKTYALISILSHNEYDKLFHYKTH